MKVYRLLPPYDLNHTIPGEGAAAEHADGDADTLGIQQSFEMQRASQAQADIWTERAYLTTGTAGRAERSVEALMNEMIDDNASTYDLIVQPQFDCAGTGFWQIDLRTSLPGIRSCAPTAIQMIPLSRRVSSEPQRPPQSTTPSKLE